MIWTAVPRGVMWSMREARIECVGLTAKTEPSQRRRRSKVFKLTMTVPHRAIYSTGEGRIQQVGSTAKTDMSSAGRRTEAFKQLMTVLCRAMTLTEKARMEKFEWNKKGGVVLLREKRSRA